MALPPQTIRIKRPRDEAPVQALYIDGNTRTPQKRQRTENTPDYVFRLARTVTSPTDPTPRPFQPRTSTPPGRRGIPRIRSTLPLADSEPGSTAVSSPMSPSAALPLTPLTPRTTTPLPGEKLALDTTTDTAPQNAFLIVPVPLSAISSNGGDRLRSEAPLVQQASRAVVAPSSPKSSSSVLVPQHQGASRQDTFGNESPRAGGLTLAVKRKNGEMEKGQEEEDEEKIGFKRRVTPVRKYQLSKRLRVRNTHHPYSNATRRSALFTRVVETHDTDTDRTREGAGITEVSPEPMVERKRPRTHPQEKKMIEEEKKRTEQEKQAKGKEARPKDEVEEDDPLAAQLQAMMFEYLNSPSNDGIRNLPPLSSSPAKSKKDMASKIGAGVGGGTWEEPEEEDRFVYDVYIRSELPVLKDKKKDGEDYGVLVIEGSEDEEWWYEGDNDEASEEEVWASDDEDSNAEDFHTNDYPDEPAYDSDGGSARPVGASDDDSDDDPNVFKPWVKGGRRFGDEEFDLDDDDEEEERRLGMKRSIWGLIGGDEADEEE